MALFSRHVIKHHEEWEDSLSESTYKEHYGMVFIQPRIKLLVTLGTLRKIFKLRSTSLADVQRLFYRRTIMVNVLSFSVTVKRHFSQFHPLLGALLILFVSTGLNEMLC